MASHCLEDDLGYSPVNEVRRVREQEGAEDQEQESVTRVALVGRRRRYAKEVGELIPNYCEWVGHNDALGRRRGPLDERHILLDRGCQFCSLKVEHCMFGVPKFDGGPQEDPVHRSFREHNHIFDDALNEGAIHRSESPPNAHDILSWWCDCLEPETGSQAVHPYLNGGDVGLTL
ncbi:hypothetical protein CRG98_013463 [Punica granatum]|uniref:Uncharacterized protein n=1 Tax=Punica granatum TaxID=22663 RepID=A0A2I0KC74_PUNGR|nr:hypothetical protein CRG98_013463 [Punica granatum]